MLDPWKSSTQTFSRVLKEASAQLIKNDHRKCREDKETTYLPRMHLVGETNRVFESSVLLQNLSLQRFVAEPPCLRLLKAVKGAHDSDTNFEKFFLQTCCFLMVSAANPTLVKNVQKIVQRSLTVKFGKVGFRLHSDAISSH